MDNLYNQRNETKWMSVTLIGFIFIFFFVIIAFANEPIEETVETQVIETSEIQIVEETVEQQIMVAETSSNQELIETAEVLEETSSLAVNEVDESTDILESTTETESTEESAPIVWPDLSNEDYNVLLKIVEAEATGQPVEGKMYVAAVVLNRVMSSDFPDSVTKVVYQKGQFSPVSDGRINCTPSETTIEAVRRVIEGETDASGATFFMNPDLASRKNKNWFRNHLTYLFTFQKHEFYK